MPHHQKKSSTPCDKFQSEMFDAVGYVSYGGFRSLQNLPRTNDFLCVTHLGEEKCEPAHDFCAPRTEYHLHFILRGKGVLEIAGQTHQLKQGDLFLIPKHTDHYYQADDKDPWHYAWVAFDGNQIEKYLHSSGFQAGSFVRPAYLPVEQYYALVQHSLNRSSDRGFLERTQSKLLYDIFSLLMRSQNESQLGQQIAMVNQKLYVMQALLYLEANYRTTTVTEVAKMVGVHRCYFSALFRAEMDLSPQTYLMQLKMKQAALLLATTPRKIFEIAVFLGYDDP